MVPLFRTVRLLGILLAALLLTAACQPAEQADPVDLTFDFAAGEEEWVGDFSDLPAEFDEELFELEAELTQRPEELGEGTAYMLAGHNRSDDLFMFLKRQLVRDEGITPDTTYDVVIEVTFGTNVPGGLFGIGGAPGESVFVKVGAADVEPVPAEDDAGDLRLNVDKGEQSQGGEYAVVVGDITKPNGDDEDDETYVLQRLSNEDAPIEVTSDSEGNLWIFVGTDSGFEGFTRLYYTEVSVTLTPR